MRKQTDGTGRVRRRHSAARVRACGALGGVGAQRPPARPSEAPRQGGRRFAGGVTGRVRVVGCAGEERLRCTRPFAVERAVVGGLRAPALNCSQFGAASSRLSPGAVPRAPRVLAVWFLALRPTRLETRTKELTTRASQWAFRTPTAQLRQNGCDPALECPAQHRPAASPLQAAAAQERVWSDPKGGELCLSRAKPEETLVEARSDPDVQIGRQT